MLIAAPAVGFHGFLIARLGFLIANGDIVGTSALADSGGFWPAEGCQAGNLAGSRTDLNL